MKAGDIIFEEQVSAAGLKTDRWLVGDLQVVRTPGAASVTLSTGRGEDDLYNCSYAHSDFSGLDWLSDDTYSEARKVGGSDCFIFRGKVSNLTQMEAVAMEHKYEVLKQMHDFALAGDTTGKGGNGMQDPNAPELRAASYRSPALACIDSITRLPVMLQVGTEIRSYQFNPTPPGPLTLPPEVQQAINQRQQRVRAAAATPAPP